MAQTSKRAGFLDISPPLHPHSRPRDDETNTENQVPVLSLTEFSRSPFVCFGTVKLGSSKSLPLRIENPTEDTTTTVTVDKISSSKGFSVGTTSFTIQPADSVIVTVSWTPVADGGVREVLSFIANGIVKHQAILLGKAEAPKKKKKTLWDSIKSKKDYSTSTKGGEGLVMPVKAANRTFHTSRQPQYRKNRVSNPLSPFNRERPSHRLGGSKEKNCQSAYPQISQALPNSLANLENTPVQNNSPIVLLVPADRFVDATENSSIPLCKTDFKEIRVLNTTLSPISTPERFSNPLKSCFQSPLPDIGKASKGESQEPGTPVLSIKDALAVIESDLTHAVSPPHACSSFNYSDSLECEKSSPECKPKAVTRAPEASLQIDIDQPRLTFFVKPSKTSGEKPVADGLVPTTTFCTSTVTKSYIRAGNELDEEVFKPKKVFFNPATVIKSKVEAPVEQSPGIRKVRTSRRRLLEKTCSFSSPTSADPNTSLCQGVSALPIIDCDTDVEFKFSVTSVPCSIQQPFPHRPSLPDDSSMSAFSVPPQSRTGTDGEQNANGREPPDSQAPDMLPTCASLEPFPVRSRTMNQNKKRKSDELSRDCSDDAVKGLHVKQSCAETREPKKPCHEKRLRAKTGQSQGKMAARPISIKSSKAPPQKSYPKSTPQGGRSLRSFGTSKVKSAKVIAVAQSRLTFIKPTQTAIPRHPLPFAAKNMFYDERWIEKQERGFTWWMNYFLTPDDFKVATEVTKVNALSLTMGDETLNIPKAPTNEEMSFRTYMARRRLNHLRRAACQLFTSEVMVKAIRRLEIEVEAKRLLVRKDRHLWKDIGERQKVLNWLLSYNPLWLRIGLETIFGELIPLESNSDVMGLAMFILRRLVWNPDIAAEFKHPKVPHLYRDGHEEALSRFTLKKLILLVCFLDKAKESRLIEHDPCLFCMDAEFKTSKDVLVAFSRDFLSGEGNLQRHLALLGLAVCHSQTPLAEFSFAVQNLAVDLRCGIRLVRIMELFTQDWSLSSQLRMPAVSRLQKVHNVEVALCALRRRGVDLADEHGTVTEARDIVDGHREKTLNLLWKIIFTFQVEILLDVEQLKEEICFLKKTWRTKQMLALLRADGCVMRSTQDKPTFQHPSEGVRLLLDWVNVVCGFYNLKVENFTVAFSDGRVLCYLIHHYHPNYLAAEDIQQGTTQTVDCSYRGKVELNDSSSDSDCSFAMEQNGSPSVDFKVLLENERSNFQLVNTAVSYLGGVPAMISPEDMSNTIPNEKVVLCYLSFLCARLLDLRNETRAARVLQSAWRRYKLQKDTRLCQQRDLAARKIQVLVRSFLQKRWLAKQVKAATIIQAFWRASSARAELRRRREAKLFVVRSAAAVLIQKMYRGWRTRTFVRKTHACVVIQTAFRKWHSEKAERRNAAAVRIQTWFRARWCRRRHLAARWSAMLVQAWFRGGRQRRCFQELKRRHWASVVIQSAVRAFLVRRRIVKMKLAAAAIQAWYRGCSLRDTERRRYLALKSAAVTLQVAFRGQRARRNEVRRRWATLTIQAAYRALVARRYFSSLKKATVLIQRRFRAKVVGRMFREQYRAFKRAAVQIQAVWRGRAQRKRMERLHRYATAIQSHCRRRAAQAKFVALKRATLVIQRRYRALRTARLVRREFVAKRKAAVAIQSAYRGMRSRQEMSKRAKAATVIQSAMRAFTCRSRFLVQKSAAVVIQQKYRACVLRRLQRDRYLRLRRAAVRLQAAYRGCRARRAQKTRHCAATVIQAHFRMYKVRVSYLAVRCAAVLIQQRYRSHVLGGRTRATYLQTKTATVAIQSAFRGMRVRRKLCQMHLAATSIQACFRGHSQCLKYRRQKWAACVIQRRFRATVMKNVAEKRYVALKTAALVIQSAYRGTRVRTRIAEMRKAAQVLQRTYRARKQCREYQALKQATVVTQRRFRAKLLAVQQWDRYRSVRRVAVALQAAYRGRRVRKKMQERHRAATVIQARYRMYRVRVSFRAARLAAVLIQRRFRGHLRRREARDRFLKLRRSAVVTQAVFRGIRTRRQITRLRFAAAVIQRRYLAYRERRRFLSLKDAVECCQRRRRAIVSARREREAFLAKRHAALVIQAAYRGTRVRQQMRIRLQAAVTIQSHVRKHINRRYYQRLLWAASTIQQRYRVNALVRRAKASMQQTRWAIVVLQAAFRGMKVRRSIRHEHQAATVLQTAFRAHCARTRYLCMKYAAIAIQQKYRATLNTRQQREYFLRLRCAAVLLQACYRGRKVRREVILQQQAATKIQAAFRRHREVIKYQAMRLSAIIIQKRYRSYIQAKVEREGYIRLRKCAILIQAGFRGHCVRRTLATTHKAATIIQGAFRMHTHRRAFRRQRRAAGVLQERFRAWALGRRQRQHFRQLKDAAVCLQKSFRGRMGREAAKRLRATRTIRSCLRTVLQRRLFLKTKAAALVIQAAYRGRRCRAQLAAKRTAATVIQRWYRSCLLVRKCRKEFQEIGKATLTLQRALRGALARRRAKRRLAAIKVQSVLRMHVSRRSYVTLRSCAVMLQAHYRSWSARRSFLCYRTAAVTLQTYYRAHRAKLEHRHRYLRMLSSVRILQARVRGLIEHRRFQKMRASALTIQACYRGMRERRKFQHIRKAAFVIQKHYMAYQLGKMERTRFLKLRSSAVFIQCEFRAYRSRKEAARTQAALKIQAWFRGRQATRAYLSKRAAIATVHRCLRTRAQRARFQAVQRSVWVIQRRWKETLLARKERADFLRVRKSAVLIQALWRASRVRRSIQKERRAAAVIQSAFRGYLRRRESARQNASALVLQHHFRAFLLAKAEQARRKRRDTAAVTLQAFCRGWLARRRAAEAARAAQLRRFATAAYHHLCAVRIQRALRAHWALVAAQKQISSVLYIQRWIRAKLQRKRYLEHRESVVKAQRAVRAWLEHRAQAATLIQRMTRRFLLRRRQEKLQHGIIKAQALWRGHRSRKLHDTSKVISIRHHLTKVNREAKEEDKLCHKTTAALSYLLEYHNYAYILLALKYLETATRLSPECCEHLVNSGATLTIFTLIRSCNRSVPSMEIITLAIQVLLNLSKYNKTIDAVYEVEDSVNTLLDLLQIYREKAGDKVADKGGSIFTKACFLLVILVQDERRAMGVKELPKALDRICSIYRLTVRKYKMDAQRTKVKQKMNASLNGCFLPPATPQKSKPRFVPDWFLQKAKQKDIVDPLGALQMLLSALGLVP
ncbi:abnormal spindle-like microcephaly-associated protein [Brachyhypopomus gauderio]|uniref:abnormal spindle-like microcephaly-associated protein n=1 Tax=Brachyhypopomus gauderio TaxID=698409 RepID=UPI0040420AE0